MQIQKPELSQEQKDKFLQELNLLVQQSDDSVQQLWNANPTVTWDLVGKPIIDSSIHLKLKSREKDKFAILFNKLNDRRL